MRELTGFIIAVVLVLVTIVIVLMFRQEMKVSKKLAGVARRRGLKFDRKDRFRIRRTLNRTFTVKGSGISFGWVRDVAHDSKIRIFRVNEVHSERKSMLAKPKTTVTGCIGAVFPAPEGETLAVESDGREVGKSYNLNPPSENMDDPRTRTVASYIKDRPAPHALYALFTGGACFAYLKPKKFDTEESESYAYMIDLAYGLFDPNMEGVAV